MRAALTLSKTYVMILFKRLILIKFEKFSDVPRHLSALAGSGSDPKIPAKFKKSVSA